MCTRSQLAKGILNCFCGTVGRWLPVYLGLKVTPFYTIAWKDSLLSFYIWTVPTLLILKKIRIFIEMRVQWNNVATNPLLQENAVHILIGVPWTCGSKLWISTNSARINPRTWENNDYWPIIVITLN